MRLIRLGALIGSVVLLVATTVSMLNSRTQLRAQQDARVIAAANIADQSVQGVLDRGLALVDAGTVASDPESLVRSFGDAAAACVAAIETDRCVGADLPATPAFEVGVRASVESGGPAVVVDESTNSLLIVERTDITIAIQVPADALIASSSRAMIEQYGAAVTIRLRADRPSQLDSTVVRADATDRDGDRVIVDVIALPGDGGSVSIASAVPHADGLASDDLAVYAVLFVLGAVLLGLAGWTFLIDRRSLERRATTDDLTGLPNRREFERLAEEELFAAERFNTGVCVMLIDLNGFKQINDTLGHQVGDLVLRAAAQRLTESVRDSDVVARWGGDEFVILLPGIQDGTAVRSGAERIGGELAAAPIAEGISITAAIGAALYPRHGTTLDELVRAADIAMYGAKTTGVTHRLADALGADEIHTPSGYTGPDRRTVVDAGRDRV